jgi:hypothetical protein
MHFLLIKIKQFFLYQELLENMFGLAKASPFI